MSSLARLMSLTPSLSHSAISKVSRIFQLLGPARFESDNERNAFYKFSQAYRLDKDIAFLLVVAILSPLRLKVVSKALRLQGHFIGTAYVREAVEFLSPTLALLWTASCRRRWFFKNRDKLISGYFLFITCHPFLFDSGLSFNILTATQLALEVGVAFAGSFLLWAPPKWVSLRILLRLIVYPGLPYFLSTDIFSTAKFLSAIFALPLFLACKMESYMLNRYRQIAPHRHDVGDVLDAFVERKATGRNCVWLLNELRFLCRIARHASLVCTYRLVLLMEDLVEYFGEIFLNFSLGIGQLSECFTQLGELVSRRSA